MARFTPGPDRARVAGVFGELGLSPVLLGRPAVFSVEVEAGTRCRGWVVFSGAPTEDWITLESIAAGSAGVLSSTWDTPVDASSDGGYVSIACGSRTLHTPFAIGAPEIGRLSSP